MQATNDETSFTLNHYRVHCIVIGAISNHISIPFTSSSHWHGGGALNR